LGHLAAKAAAPPPASSRGLLSRHFVGNQEHQNPAADRLQEVPAVELEAIPRLGIQFIPFGLEHVLGDDQIAGVNGLAHRTPLFTAAPAWRMARTILEYVPQRHTFPSMARTISEAAGSLVFASNATADMIMPAVQ